MEFNTTPFKTNRFKHIYTAGTYTKSELCEGAPFRLGFGSPKMHAVEKKVRFDTRNGDEENLTGAWEREYEATFPLLSVYFYLVTDKHEDENPCPVALLLLDGHPCVEIPCSHVEVNVSTKVKEPEAHILFRQERKRQGAVFSKIEVRLRFKSRRQMSARLKELEPETDTITDPKKAECA